MIGCREHSPPLLVSKWLIPIPRRTPATPEGVSLPNHDAGATGGFYELMAIRSLV